MAISALGKVYGLDPQTGVTTWELDFNYGQIGGGISIGDYIAFTSSNEGLLILDGNNGKPIQSFEIGAEFTWPPVARPPFLALLSANGLLYNFIHIGHIGLVR